MGYLLKFMVLYYTGAKQATFLEGNSWLIVYNSGDMEIVRCALFTGCL